MDVHADTGLVMNGRGRLMASIKIGPTSEFFKSLPVAYVPVYRGDQIGSANAMQAWSAYTLRLVQGAVSGQQITIMLIGAGSLVIGLALCFKRSKKSPVYAA